MIPILHIALLLVSTFVLLLIRSRDWYASYSRRILSHIPGPKGVVLFGNALQLLGRKPHETFLKWSNAYGKLYKVNLPGLPIVIVTDAQIAHKLLSSSALNLPKSHIHKNGIWAHSDRGIAPSPFFNGESALNFRKCLQKVWAPAFVKDNVFSIADRHAARLVSVISSAIQQDLTAHVNVSVLCEKAMLDFILAHGWNRDANFLGGDSPYLYDCWSYVGKMYSELRNPFKNFFCTVMPFLPSARRLQRSLKECNRLQHELAQQSLEQPDSGHLATALFNCSKLSGLPDGLDYDEIASNISFLTKVGPETTASQTSWLLYDIARNPEIQKRIKDELLSAGLLVEQGRPSINALSYDALFNLPYFNKVLLESIRMHGNVGVVFRETQTDIKLDGYEVPSGTQVWIDLNGLHNSNRNFENATQFNPDRWDVADEQALFTDMAISTTPSRPLAKTFVAFSGNKIPNPFLSQTDPESLNQTFKASAASDMIKTPSTKSLRADIHSLSRGLSFASAKSDGKGGTKRVSNILPFSYGPRDCIGKSLGEMLIKLFVLSILRYFWIEVEESMGDYDTVIENTHVVLSVKHNSGHKIKFRKHT